jgi:hypothetical protein
MRWKLRVRIVEVDGRQNRAARELSMSEPKLSRIINEFDEPTPEERKRIVARYGPAVLEPARLKSRRVTELSPIK